MAGGLEQHGQAAGMVGGTRRCRGSFWRAGGVPTGCSEQRRRRAEVRAATGSAAGGAGGSGGTRGCRRRKLEDQAAPRDVAGCRGDQTLTLTLGDSSDTMLKRERGENIQLVFT